MAYTNVQSGEIPEGTQYYSGKLPLGDYNFYLSVDATGVSPKIVAQCESPDGTVRTAASRTWPAGTQVTQWSVEANETEASVYVTFGKPTIKSVLITTDVNDVPLTSSKSLWRSSYQIGTLEGHPAYYCKVNPGTDYVTRYNGKAYAANAEGNRGAYIAYGADGQIGFVASGANSGANKIFAEIYGNNVIFANVPESAINPAGKSAEGSDFDGGERLVARFAIDLGTAGGYPGGGGEWISRGDWNIDPTTTLHLTVNGALSGRHNDPLHDPSYSCLPADKATVKGYGTGGDGGNGGGGGAGASTIIVRQFATNKANSKEIFALAKRHGYGSGGGKGGQGGDGCILIYY